MFFHTLAPFTMLTFWQHINVQQENTGVEILTCDGNIFTHVYNNRTDKAFCKGIVFYIM